MTKPIVIFLIQIESSPYILYCKIWWNYFVSCTTQDKACHAEYGRNWKFFLVAKTENNPSNNFRGMSTVYRYSDFWNWSLHRYRSSCPFHLIRYATQHTYRIHCRPSLLTVSFCIIECLSIFCAEAEPPFMKVTTLINLLFPSKVWSALKVIRLFVIQNASTQTF